jgi:hypothetical protein
MKTHYDQIYFANSKKLWINALENQTPAWCFYDDNPINESYGKLYNWYALKMLSEIEQLDKENFSLKNESNGGIRYVDGEFYSIGNLSTFWLLKEKNFNMAYCMFRTIDSKIYKQGCNFKGCGFNIFFDR